MSRDKAGDSAADQAGQGFQEKAEPETSAKATRTNKQVKFNSVAQTSPF